MRRRHFLAAGSAALLTAPAWASLPPADFIAAGARPGNSTWLVGLTATGEVPFAFPVPGRGHAAAVHPERAEAVAFARRPGRFAVVIDCSSGTEIARLDSPADRHFYGHGAFTADGRFLLTTENAYDIPDGRIGIWDAEKGYARLGEFPSGGIGPHEVIRLPDGIFAIANGGIQTHPDFARKKLNIPAMQPNLTYVDAEGAILEQVTPPEDLRRNSIRHLAADRSGQVAIALQWQGAPFSQVPLIARHQRGEPLRFVTHPQMAELKHYAGSIAVSSDGSEIALTGPKGNRVLFFDATTGAPGPVRSWDVASGAATTAEGVAITVKGGVRIGTSVQSRFIPVTGDWAWDNHLVALPAT
ncbi:hypothetical protein CLV78_10363 [Aliiruegeria haliotis]|uniref:DUF1513 domain-containing protein n=1 Tax=Aliiruegeria haliotis TaxID=1280846 RepID=A0A2T0RSM4_9RHOB|nr:DUF1513 domain-containing protein [Aliiruegeria haliotis]PRY24199.1 hypothetical protein CLV78_10363 [Aliiruegeria haliotis]